MIEKLIPCRRGADPGFLEKEFRMYKGVGVRFADFISFLLNIPLKRNNLVSPTQNYFIFIVYLKMGMGFKRTPSGYTTAEFQDSC